MTLMFVHVIPIHRYSRKKEKRKKERNISRRSWRRFPRLLFKQTWHFLSRNVKWNTDLYMCNTLHKLKALLWLFVAASHQTGLDTRSKARRPIKVGIEGRGRSGTSRDSNPAGLCCSSVHLVQCEPDEASSFTNRNVSLGTYAGLWLELDSKV